MRLELLSAVEQHILCVAAAEPCNRLFAPEDDFEVAVCCPDVLALRRCLLAARVDISDDGCELWSHVPHEVSAALRNAFSRGFCGRG